MAATLENFVDTSVTLQLPEHTAYSDCAHFLNRTTSIPIVILARLNESPIQKMDPPSLPPSPTKLAMSPSMPVFPSSPERTKTSLGDSVVLSPSATRRGSRSGSPLREGSPLRSSHRRTDSEVSVAGLATMFETLEVKDPREARDRYM